MFSVKKRYLSIVILIISILIHTALEINSYDNIGVNLRQLHKQSKLRSAIRHNDTLTVIQKAKLKAASNSYIDPMFPNVSESPQLENATILMLCRNFELSGVLKSMRSLEDRFNKDYHYTWTFLNDVEFTEKFKYETTAMASGKTEYGLIPTEDWNTPSHINDTKYQECVDDFAKREVIYGFSKSYRNMCHFNSGHFYKQELVMKYEWYFRVEPDVEYFCDFQMDPFRLLRENNKKYGFVITLLEYPETIESLWDTVEDFLNEYPQYLHKNSAIEFVTDQDPIGPIQLVPENESSYNLCHFWSNFEIGNLNFFRSEEYEAYFTYLSMKGGFYYERWGDAPVHTIGAALLMDKNDIHHFEDIGYSHTPFFTCPVAEHLKVGKRCICPNEGEGTIDLEAHSCLSRWWKFGSGKRFTKEYFHEEDYI